MDKKAQILEIAVRHFNEQGYGAATLQSLAQEIGISRGNLTYHFKTKELLLEAMVEQMWERLKAERAKTMDFPSFENLQSEIRTFQRIQQEYAFMFLDAHVFLIPGIREGLQAYREKTINNCLTTIALSIRMGNMQEEVVPGTYINLCKLVWMISFYWISQQAYLSEDRDTTWDRVMWSMLLPYFTPKGQKAFTDFFGAAYVESLGKPFSEEFKSIATI